MLEGSTEAFHAYAFHNPRMVGASMELLAGHVRWLFSEPGEKAAAHLDVRVGQAGVTSELARLTSLGAVVVGRVVLAETSPTPWTRFVLADPEGNQFCVQ